MMAVFDRVDWFPVRRSNDRQVIADWAWHLGASWEHTCGKDSGMNNARFRSLFRERFKREPTDEELELCWENLTEGWSE